MPYKDEQKQKEYQHNAYLRKKLGLPTRTTPISTPETIHEHQIERCKRYRQRKRQYIIKMFGDKCVICGRRQIVIIHRKDGKPHKKFADMSLKQLKEELENHKDEYVRVCGICHAGIHWAMKYLNLKWENIPTQK